MTALVIYAIFFFTIVFLIFSIGNLLIMWMDLPYEEYPEEQIQHRFNRDNELQSTYFRLRLELGREPTVRELWAASPPYQCNYD